MRAAPPASQDSVSCRAPTLPVVCKLSYKACCNNGWAGSTAGRQIVARYGYRCSGAVQDMLTARRKCDSQLSLLLHKPRCAGAA
jgi:hypothetical protein